MIRINFKDSLYLVEYNYERGMRSNDYDVPDDPDEIRILEVLTTDGVDVRNNMSMEFELHVYEQIRDKEN